MGIAAGSVLSYESPSAGKQFDLQSSPHLHGAFGFRSRQWEYSTVGTALVNAYRRAREVTVDAYPGDSAKFDDFMDASDSDVEMQTPGVVWAHTGSGDWYQQAYVMKSESQSHHRAANGVVQLTVLLLDGAWHRDSPAKEFTVASGQMENGDGLDLGVDLATWDGKAIDIAGSDEYVINPTNPDKDKDDKGKGSSSRQWLDMRTDLSYDLANLDGSFTDDHGGSGEHEGGGETSPDRLTGLSMSGLPDSVRLPLSATSRSATMILHGMPESVPLRNIVVTIYGPATFSPSSNGGELTFTGTEGTVTVTAYWRDDSTVTVSKVIPINSR